MRILLIASAYNSMTQRVYAELADRGHEVSVELALGDEVMRDGVRRYDPDLVIAPMLTRAIPADVWSAWPCFIVHPGPMGDCGPSSLDWAIMAGAERWGVTILQANAEMIRSPAYPALLTAKARQLATADQHRPLAAYRAAELAVMSRNFSDPREPYADLRRAFVYKGKALAHPAPPRQAPGAASDGARCGRSGGTQTIPSLKPAEPIPNAALKRSRFTSVSRAVISTSWRSSK